MDKAALSMCCRLLWFSLTTLCAIRNRSVQDTLLS